MWSWGGIGRGVAVCAGASAMLLASCTDTAPKFGPFAQSGTRIVYEGYRVGGIEVVVTQTDSLLGERCQYAVASDGVMRCLPTSTAFQQVYDNANCNGPALWVSWRDECSPPRYGVHPAGYCEPRTLSKLTATTPPSAMLYELTFDGTCEVSSVNDTLAAFDFFTGELAPADGFAAASDSFEHNTDGIGVAVRLGQDGSKRVLGAHDVRYGRTVARDLTDVGRRFVPSDAGWVGSSYYSDASCSQLAAWTFNCDPSPPLWAVAVLEDRTSLHELGDETDTIYSRSPAGICEPVEDPIAADPLRTFHLGPRVTNPPLSPAGESVFGGNLSVSVTTTARGEVVTAGELRFGDTPCDPRIESGRIYCTPTGAPATPGRFYIDASCSQSVHRLVDDQQPGDWLRGASTAEPDCGTISATNMWFIMGEEYLGDVWELDDGECKSIRNAPSVHYHLPEPIGIDTFPTLELVRLD